MTVSKPLPSLVLALLGLASTAHGQLPDHWQQAAQRSPNTRLASLYRELPAVEQCREGQLTTDALASAIAAVNAVRALHRLPPVAHDPRGDVVAAKAALIIAANRKMSHTPDRNWKCSTSAGRSGSGESNLYYGTFAGEQVPSTDTLVAGWIRDVGVPLLGHRRWLLSPLLGPVSFGRVDHAAKSTYGAAMRVFGEADPMPELRGLQFVAYPFERYPASLFDQRAEWSLSMVEPDAATNREPFDYFSGAAVAVTDEATGRRADVSRLTRDSQGFGLPNLLSWRVSEAAVGRWYVVRVENVRQRRGGPRAVSWRVFIDAAAPTTQVDHKGLKWERKTANNRKELLTLEAARSYCRSIGGRVPTRAELTKLVVPGRKFAIDTAVFPNVSEYANYWTSSPWDPGRSPLVDIVAFWSGGAIYQQDPGKPAAVLCVMGR